MRTHIKRVEKLIEQNDAEGVKKALPDTLKTIGKTAKRGIVHKRNAARKESRLMLKVNKLLKTQEEKPPEEKPPAEEPAE
jgi:small subunit ribosomal protein S20